MDNREIVTTPPIAESPLMPYNGFNGGERNPPHTKPTTMDFFFAPDLRSFIDDNPMIDLDTACDFVCEKFDINLTDSLLDEIAEVFFEHEDVAFRLGLS